MTNLELFASIATAFIVSAIGPTVVEWAKLKLAKKEPFSDPVKAELVKSCIIDREIETIMDTLGADRVWISQFHNGGKFLHSTKSIQKFSIFHEVNVSGVSPVAHTFRNIPASLYSRAFDELLKNGSIFIADFQDETIATYGLKGGAEAVGTRASYVFGLFNLGTNEFMGTLGVDWVKKPKQLKADQLAYLSAEANRLSGYISNFLQDEK
jgi:hypothetical protein